MQNRKKIVIAIMAVVLIVACFLSSVVFVKAGHSGVVTTLGKVEDRVLSEGLNFKIPFVQKVVQIDNRIVKLEVQTEAFSKDLQTVDTILAINYRVDSKMSADIYKNVGMNYEDILIAPAVNEVLKATTSQHTAEESVTNRSLISEGLIGSLNEKLNRSGLYVTDVNIINFDFSEAFTNAIEEKQIAQQQLLKAETEKETAITNAQAEAEAIRIKAQAEAEANKVLSESLNDKVIDYLTVEKWNGQLPKVTGSEGLLINLED